jgi:hypothetical protein
MKRLMIISNLNQCKEVHFPPNGEDIAQPLSSEIRSLVTAASKKSVREVHNDAICNKLRKLLRSQDIDYVVLCTAGFSAQEVAAFKALIRDLGRLSELLNCREHEWEID